MEREELKHQLVLEHLHHSLSSAVHHHSVGLLMPSHHDHLPHLPDLSDYKGYPPTAPLSTQAVVFALRKIYYFHPQYFNNEERNILNTLKPGVVSYAIPMSLTGLGMLTFAYGSYYRAFGPRLGAAVAGCFLASALSERVVNFSREWVQEWRRRQLAPKYLERLGEEKIRKVLDARSYMAKLL